MRKPRNKFESKVYAQLEQSKAVFEYEPCKLPYVLSRHYIPDFVVHTRTGLLYIECKGYFRPEHKCKLLAVRRYHPELDLRILFYASNKKNIKWAEKNGIKYAINRIPQEWLEGF